MKTNQIMTRPMGRYTVHQRTKDSMFNATDLLRQWNDTPGNTQRRLDKFWDSTHLHEFMLEIVKDPANGFYVEDFKSPDLGDLKSLLTKTGRGRYGGGTWMHPYLFVKFAMYLNPAFEYQVVKFVGDQLINYRHAAGDHYIELCNALARWKPIISYPDVAKALNCIVFGGHGKGLRQKGTIAQIDEMQQLERNLAYAVNSGFIPTPAAFFDHLRDLYKKKWQ